jgi:hypothetical protein
MRIGVHCTSEGMKARVAVDALNEGVARRGSVTKRVVLLDRGSQGEFILALRHYGRVGLSGESGWGRG